MHTLLTYTGFIFYITLSCASPPTKSTDYDLGQTTENILHYRFYEQNIIGVSPSTCSDTEVEMSDTEEDDVSNIYPNAQTSLSSILATSNTANTSSTSLNNTWCVGIGSSSAVLVSIDNHVIVASKYVPLKKIASNANLRREQGFSELIEENNTRRLLCRHFSFPDLYRIRIWNDEYFVIDQEYLPGGTLAAILEKNGPLNVNTARHYAAQLLVALLHLSDNNMVFCNISPANIMLTREGCLKLVDFKRAVPAGDAMQIRSRTSNTLAPECSKSAVTFAADVWSWGCVLFSMLTGRDLYSDNPNAEAVDWSVLEFPPLIRDIFMKVLHADPLKRPSVTALMSEPWFAGINWREIDRVPPFFKDHMTCFDQTVLTADYVNFTNSQYSGYTADDLDEVVCELHAYVEGLAENPAVKPPAFIPAHVRAKVPAKRVPVYTVTVSKLDSLTGDLADVFDVGPIDAAFAGLGRRIEFLGCGANGSVWLFSMKDLTKVSIKAIPIKSIAQEPRDLYDEVNSLIRLSGSHPAFPIANFIFSDLENVYIGMEHISGGTLVQCNGPLPLDIVRLYSAQLLGAIEYLESQSLVHRDIAARNIMFTESGVLKLIDFGLMISSGHASDIDPAFPLEFGAPETRGGVVATSSDLWSWGNCLFWMVSGGYYLYSEKCVCLDLNHFSARLLRIDQDLRDVILAVMVKDPQGRASVRQLKAMKWFSGVDWQTVSTTPPSTLSHMPSKINSGRRKRLDYYAERMDAIQVAPDTLNSCRKNLSEYFRLFQPIAATASDNNSGDKSGANAGMNDDSSMQLEHDITC